MTIHYAFPVPIYHENITSEVERGFNKTAYHKAKEIRENNETGQKWLCDTFNTSNVNLLKDSVIYQDFLNICSRHVYEFSKKAYGVPIEDGANLICVDFWINIAPPGAYQEFHVHPMSNFSAVYYAKVPKGDCGLLYIQNPNSNFDMYPLYLKDKTPAAAVGLEILPEEGSLVIFRSNLLHAVTKNYTDEDRVSIAINFKFKGKE